MARQSFSIPNYYYLNYSGNETKFRAYWSSVRDHIRTKLSSSAGTDYKVSDIFTWTGFFSNKGYGFLIDFRSSGTPIGDQIVFLFNYANNGSTSTHDILGNRNSATCNTYFDINGIEGSTNAYNEASGFTILYLPKGGDRKARITITNTGGSSTVTEGDEFRNADESSRGIVTALHSQTDIEIQMTQGGAFTTGDTLTNQNTLGTFDFDSETWRGFIDVGWSSYADYTLSSEYASPHTNPYSALATFLPKTAAGCGFSYFKGKVQGFGTYVRTFQCIIDNTFPMCMIYNWIGVHVSLANFMLAGKIFINEDEDTTYQRGIFSVDVTPDVYQGYFTEFYNIDGEYNSDGSVTKFDYRDHANFTFRNYITDDGTFNEDLVAIYNENEIKGWLDLNLVRIQGGSTRHPFFLTTRNGANHCIKIHRNFMTPWHTDIFPGLLKYDTSDGSYPPSEAF